MWRKGPNLLKDSLKIRHANNWKSFFSHSSWFHKSSCIKKYKLYSWNEPKGSPSEWEREECRGESRNFSMVYSSVHSTSRNRTSAPLPLPSPSWCLIPFTRSQITILAIDRHLKTEIGTMEGSHAILMWLKVPLKNVKTWKFSYIILGPPRKIFLVVLPVFWSIFSTWNTLLYVCLN